MRLKGPALALLIGCLAVFSQDCEKAAEVVDTRYTCSDKTATCVRLQADWSVTGKTVSSSSFTFACVVTLPDGRFRLYGNKEASTATVKHIGSWISTDGLTYTEEDGFRISGNDVSMPSVVILPDGRFRMYCTDLSVIIGSGGGRAIMSAISDDGLTFTRETGDRLTYLGTGNEKYGVLGPNVLVLTDGTYRMYYRAWDESGSIVKILSAVSEDGLVWTREPGVRWDPRDLCPAVLTTGNAKPYLDSSGVTHLFISGVACKDLLETDETFGIYDAVSPDGLTFTASLSPLIEGYYDKNNYKGNANDPRFVLSDPVPLLTPTGFVLYFYSAYTGSSPSEEDVGYFTATNPTFH